MHVLISQEAWTPYLESFIINRGYVMNIRRARSLTELATVLYTHTHNETLNAHINKDVYTHAYFAIVNTNTHMLGRTSIDQSLVSH